MPSRIVGTPRSFYDKFKFLVEINGIRYAGFMKCSELAIEVAKIEHWEGGRTIADKSPGRITIPDITLERGATDDLETYEWMEEVAKMSAGGTGLVDDQYKRDGEIIQLNRNDTVRQRWRTKKMFPTKFVAGEWDNGSDEKVVTSLTLALDWFEPMIRRRR